MRIPTENTSLTFCHALWNVSLKKLATVENTPFMPSQALDAPKIQSIDIAGAKPFSGLVSRISVPQIPELEHGIGLAKKGHQYLLNIFILLCILINS